MSWHYSKLRDEKYFIAVASRSRSFMIAKHTGVWKYFTGQKYPLELFVRRQEEKAYAELAKYPINLVPDELNLAQKRQRILEYCHERSIPVLLMLDDDVSFYYRDEELSSKYTSHFEKFIARDALNKTLFEAVKLCSEEFPMVGLPMKQGSQGRRYAFEKNVPIIRFMAFHVPTLIKSGIRFDGLGVPNMSDRYMQLSLLEKGFRTLTNCRWAIGDMGTGYHGGCQDTRTVELQSLAARSLQKRFPKSVSLKIKSDGRWSEERLDCNIMWKSYLSKDERKYVPQEEGLVKIYGEAINHA